MKDSRGNICKEEIGDGNGTQQDFIELILVFVNFNEIKEEDVFRFCTAFNFLISS